MNKKNFLPIIFACIIIFCFFVKKIKNTNKINPKQQVVFSQEEVKEISHHLAHLLIDDLHTFTPYYDFNEVISTMSEIEYGKTQIVPPEKSRLALIDYEDKILEEEEKNKIEIINYFIKSLIKNKNIVEVDKNKLYYEIMKEGLGLTVTENSTPLIHFTEYDLSGTILQDTRENQPRKIVLKETVPGFRDGVVGMKVGERRKIYVHTDLTYGRVGKYSQNLLIIFDVEIIGISNDKHALI